jgi:hypothetical protein
MENGESMAAWRKAMAAKGVINIEAKTGENINN